MKARSKKPQRHRDAGVRLLGTGAPELDPGGIEDPMARAEEF